MTGEKTNTDWPDVTTNVGGGLRGGNSWSSTTYFDGEVTVSGRRYANWTPSQASSYPQRYSSVGIRLVKRIP